MCETLVSSCLVVVSRFLQSSGSTLTHPMTVCVCFLDHPSTYFITMSIHYLYSMYIEKNTFMLAREKDSAGLVCEISVLTNTRGAGHVTHFSVHSSACVCVCVCVCIVCVCVCVHARIVCVCVCVCMS